MLDWASQERSAHALIVRVEKTQLAGHNFAGLFLDRLEELLGKQHPLSCAQGNCEKAIRDTSTAQLRAHWLDPHPLLQGGINDVSVHGPTRTVRSFVFDRVRAQYPVHAFTELQLRNYDIEADPVANPSVQEADLRVASMSYQNSRLVDTNRAAMYAQGTDQALSLFGEHIVPSLARELHALRIQIPQAARDDVTQDYSRVMTHNFVTVVHGHSRVKIADRHLDLLLQCSRARATHDSMVAVLSNIHCAPTHLQGLATSIAISSLSSSTSSSIPAIVHMVQAMSASYDALPEAQLLPHAENMCSRMAELERSKKIETPAPSSSSARAMTAASKKTQVKKTAPPRATRHGTNASPPVSGTATPSPRATRNGTNAAPTVSDPATATPRATRRGTSATPPVDDQATATPRATRNGSIASTRGHATHTVAPPRAHGTGVPKVPTKSSSIRSSHLSPSHTTSLSPSASVAGGMYDDRLCSEEEINELKNEGATRDLNVYERIARVDSETMSPSKHLREEERLERHVVKAIAHMRKHAGSPFKGLPSPSSSCDSSPTKMGESRSASPTKVGESVKRSLRAPSAISTKVGESNDCSPRAPAPTPRTYAQAAIQGERTMLDGGCGPAHVASLRAAAGPTRPSTSAIIGVGGIMLLGNKSGTGVVHTVNSLGKNTTIILPGTTLFPKSGVDVNLVSHSTLLEHGWEITLATDGGQAVSPIGTHYTLVKRGSSWYFPSQSSSPSLSKASTSSARPLHLPAGSKNKGPIDNKLRHKAPSAAQSKRTDNGYSNGKPNRAAIGTTDLRSNKSRPKTVNNDRSVSDGNGKNPASYERKVPAKRGSFAPPSSKTNMYEHLDVDTHFWGLLNHLTSTIII